MTRRVFETIGRLLHELLDSLESEGMYHADDNTFATIEHSIALYNEFARALGAPEWSRTVEWFEWRRQG